MGKTKQVGAFRDSKKIREQKEAIRNTMNVVEAVKMITLYALRNQGWGKTRLKRFSDKWNESIVDVSDGWYSLTDIMETIELETGLTMNDLKIPHGTTVDK